MLEKAPTYTHSKKSTQTRSPHLIEQYRQFIVKDLLWLPNICKANFFLLLKHIPISEIEKSVSFLALRDKVRLLVSSREVFAFAARSLVKTNNLPNLKYLIETCGFDLSSAKSNMGDTLLHFACEANHKEIILYLLQKGFDINAENSIKQRPIHDLVRFKGNGPLISQINKRYPIDLNSKNPDVMTPLHIAACMGNDKVISVLLIEKPNESILFNGKGYRQLRQSARAGKILLNITASQSVDVPAEKNRALYAKALFLDKFEQNCFKTCFKFFKNELLQAGDQASFFYTYILSSNLTVKNIQNFFNNYVKTGKVTTEIFLNALQHGIIKFFLEIGITPYEKAILKFSNESA